MFQRDSISPAPRRAFLLGIGASLLGGTVTSQVACTAQETACYPPPTPTEPQARFVDPSVPFFLDGVAINPRGDIAAVSLNSVLQMRSDIHLFDLESGAFSLLRQQDPASAIGVAGFNPVSGRLLVVQTPSPHLQRSVVLEVDCKTGIADGLYWTPSKYVISPTISLDGKRMLYFRNVDRRDRNGISCAPEWMIAQKMAPFLLDLETLREQRLSSAVWTPASAKMWFTGEEGVYLATASAIDEAEDPEWANSPAGDTGTPQFGNRGFLYRAGYPADPDRSSIIPTEVRSDAGGFGLIAASERGVRFFFRFDRLRNQSDVVEVSPNRPIRILRNAGHSPSIAGCSSNGEVLVFNTDPDLNSERWVCWRPDSDTTNYLRLGGDHIPEVVVPINVRSWREVMV